MQAQHPIRVLRSSKLNSSMVPRAGLRYDGLYRVIGYTTHLEQDEKGNDVWDFAFHMARLIHQDSIEQKLAIPLVDPMDDWKDYQRMNAEQEAGGLMNMMLLPSKSEIHIPGGGGYFMAKPPMAVLPPAPEILR